MQHKKQARILLQFFWEQRIMGLFLVLAVAIFALVFAMYDIKSEAILYASMLCLAAGLLFEGVLSVDMQNSRNACRGCRFSIRNYHHFARLPSRTCKRWCRN